MIEIHKRNKRIFEKGCKKYSMQLRFFFLLDFSCRNIQEKRNEYDMENFKFSTVYIGRVVYKFK